MRTPPIGVAILGFFALVNGIAAVIIGLQLMGVVAFGPVSSGTGVFFWGLLAFILGLLYIAVAYGAWTVRIWAWTFGMLIAILGIFNAVMIVFATGDLSKGIAAALLPGIVLWYLNSSGVKEAFVEGEQAAGQYASEYDREQAERMMAERQDDTLTR
jgi:hypothetical protein